MDEANPKSSYRRSLQSVSHVTAKRRKTREQLNQLKKAKRHGVSSHGCFVLLAHVFLNRCRPPGRCASRLWEALA